MRDVVCGGTKNETPNNCRVTETTIAHQQKGSPEGLRPFGRGFLGERSPPKCPKQGSNLRPTRYECHTPLEVQ